MTAKTKDTRVIFDRRLKLEILRAGQRILPPILVQTISGGTWHPPQAVEAARPQRFGRHQLRNPNPFEEIPPTQHRPPSARPTLQPHHRPRRNTKSLQQASRDRQRVKKPPTNRTSLAASPSIRLNGDLPETTFPGKPGHHQRWAARRPRVRCGAPADRNGSSYVRGQSNRQQQTTQARAVAAREKMSIITRR